jgi:hypothetical protein
MAGVVVDELDGDGGGAGKTRKISSVSSDAQEVPGDRLARRQARCRDGPRGETRRRWPFSELRMQDGNHVRVSRDIQKDRNGEIGD